MIDLNHALLRKRSEYQNKQHKVILLGDNASSHRARPTKETVELVNWEPLAHAAYSLGLTSFDSHLLLLRYALTEQHFVSYENVKNWRNEWFALKDEQLFSFTNGLKNMQLLMSQLFS